MSFLNKNQVIVFDFDGTLLNSMGDFGDMAASSMQKVFSCDYEWAKKRYKETSGLPFPFQLEQIYPGDSRNAEANRLFVEKKMAFYRDAPYFSDVWPALLELKKRGHHLVISSNNDQEIVDDKLKTELGFFDAILGYSEGFLKGEDHFNWICNYFNCSINDILFVGDSLHDGQMADESNVTFIARSGTFEKEAFVRQGIAATIINHLGELVDLKDMDSAVTPPLYTPHASGSLSRRAGYSS
ncbi:HAD-IA family hydrolase [bacterium]|nr:HAD-IA family hydrolase [bacterium]